MNTDEKSGLCGVLKVSMIGRPNVGKSSLYNCLVKKRLAIVDPSPGVTRDRQYCSINYQNAEFVFVDTGGIEKRPSDTRFSDLVKEQSLYALAEADVILFVVEVFGLTADDYKILELLRKSSKPVLLLVNKCDTPKLEYLTDIPYELGIGESVCVSALHNRGIDTVLKLLYGHVKWGQVAQPSYGTDIRVAFIGRPNVGKSTLLNTILGTQRSLTSEVPGTTRDAIEDFVCYESYRLCCVDTAGMRRKARVHENVEYYSVNRAIQSIRKSDVVVHLIDSLEHITSQDKKIAALTLKYGKAMLIVINKWELVKGVEDFEEYREKIRFRFAVARHVPVLSISAKTGLRVQKLLATVVQLYHQASKKLSTSELNNFIHGLQSQHRSQKKGLKVYYATQVKVMPPTFLFFVNHEDLWTSNYESYFINQLREYFGFSGVPIVITVKKSTDAPQ